MAAEKQQFIDDQRSHNGIEGEIGHGIRRHGGLGLICKKLPATKGFSCALNVLLMNLQKLLELLFVLLTHWLHSLLDTEAGERHQSALVGDQMPSISTAMHQLIRDNLFGSFTIGFLSQQSPAG